MTCFGSEYKTVEYFTRFTSEELGQLLAKNSKNSKKTTRWTTSANWRIFAELDNPLSPKLADKYALSKMNLTSIEVTMFELVFKLKMYFE